MIKNKLIIWGATGQAIVLEELVSDTGMSIEAFFENNNQVKSPFDNIPIYYGIDAFQKWLYGINDIHNYHYAVAIGGEHGGIRRQIGEKLKQHGLIPFNSIHRTAFVSYNAILGEGLQILANTSICARACLGNYVIVNTSASIDHECQIKDGVHVGPGAKLAGCVELNENVFIGTNATILPRIKIGENSIVGAGAVVTKNVPPNCIVAGNPAKIIKQIK